ncbi:MAG TPA: HigA family addiction module antitoxin [Sumerlaeia bacterium]|nr:HigA family addiction module antitoxin [Sumerlaeia bacterium]
MISTADRPYQPDFAVPPGETLRETIESRGMSQAELARRLGRYPDNVNEIIQGKKAITAETALRLESVLGVPAHFWMSLQTQYDETVARLARAKQFEDEKSLARRFPYTEMAKLGWVRATRDGRERVQALQEYFAVSSLSLVRTFHDAAYRKSGAHAASPEAIAAWIRRGEILAQDIETQPYDESRLRRAIPQLRRLTLPSPPVFEPRLREICAGCGVAVAVLPHLAKTYVNGATEWLRPDKALVILSLRYRWADVFWFSLFHELAHILRHRKKTFVEYREGLETKEESEADSFAADSLIPRAAFSRLAQRTFLSRAQVTAFARENGVAPGIVVGRLQHEGVVRHSEMNDLREQYTWPT